MDKIPTNKGNMTIPQIMNMLMYGSYKANRDLGVKHETLIKFGIGNEEMKTKYELDQKGISEN